MNLTTSTSWTTEPVTITLDLVSVAATGTANPWRISDITYLRDGKSETLRGLFKH